MPTIDVAFTKLAVSKSAKEDVMGPQDLRGFNVRTVSVSAAGGSGKLALVDAAIEVSPTADGPWFAIDLGSSGLATLAAGGNCVVRTTDIIDRFMRVQAKGANGSGQSDVTVYLTAFGY